MKQRPGLSAVCTILRRDLHKRFSCFLHPIDWAFQPKYIIATFLDFRYRIVLSNDQIKYVKSFFSNQLREPMVSSH